MNKDTIVNLGDECKIILPEEPIDCSSLGYFDELEYECWDLVLLYCRYFGIEIFEDEEESISFDIAKEIQDLIITKLEECGVKFKFSDIEYGEV